MNILKHMEAVFVAAVVLTAGTSYAIDTLPQAQAKVAITASAAVQAPVVVIKARRMSAEEKRRSLQAERAADGQFAAAQTAAGQM